MARNDFKTQWPPSASAPDDRNRADILTRLLAWSSNVRAIRESSRPGAAGVGMKGDDADHPDLQTALIRMIAGVAIILAIVRVTAMLIFQSPM